MQSLPKTSDYTILSTLLAHLNHLLSFKGRSIISSLEIKVFAKRHIPKRSDVFTSEMHVCFMTCRYLLLNVPITFPSSLLATDSQSWTAISAATFLAEESGTAMSSVLTVICYQSTV